MRRGFTLIELLGVITILGIIALITIPIVTNIIKSAKEDTERTNKDLYIKAVVNTLANEKIKSDYEPQTCQILGSTVVVGTDETDKVSYVAGDLLCDGINYIKVETTGERPISGYLNIRDGKVVESTINYK